MAEAPHPGGAGAGQEGLGGLGEAKRRVAVDRIAGLGEPRRLDNEQAAAEWRK
jgi:hypothetical protein